MNTAKLKSKALALAIKANPGNNITDALIEEAKKIEEYLVSDLCVNLVARLSPDSFEAAAKRNQLIREASTLND